MSVRQNVSSERMLWNVRSSRGLVRSATMLLWNSEVGVADRRPIVDRGGARNDTDQLVAGRVHALHVAVRDGVEVLDRRELEQPANQTQRSATSASVSSATVAVLLRSTLTSPSRATARTASRMVFRETPNWRDRPTSGSGAPGGSCPVRILSRMDRDHLLVDARKVDCRLSHLISRTSPPVELSRNPVVDVLIGRWYGRRPAPRVIGAADVTEPE